MELHKFQSTNFIIGLRAIAILLVFLIHSGGGGLKETNDIFSLFVDFGKFGVQIFFVISGFTIFYQFYTSGYSFNKFIFNRIARISTPYFPLIILLYLYTNNGGEIFNSWTTKFCNDKITLENIFYHITYLASFRVDYANSIIGVEWTLHIEVFYYFIIGFLISLNFLKLNLKRLIMTLFIFMVIALVMIVLSHLKIYDSYFIYWMPFRHGWFFILGGLAYYFRNVVNEYYSIKTKYLLSNIAIVSTIIAIILLLNIKLLNHIGYINEVIFAGVTFFLIIFVNDKAKLTKLLINKPMLFLGNISFSFYLLHIIIINTNIINNLLEINNQILLFLINFIVTIIISYLWYKLFEDMVYKRIKYFLKQHIR